ncbi:MAG: DUF308 domain-containing protein [Atopobiaceae bacterium]|jgi:uncharacterized membrane protein HdeD (DUF308 family)|nr:DUF308 domain-containing protein [Atopobiaceae bacterium]MCH4119165.1 DUF308 domain-containing protein [Atopobiaceae bacterium]MCI1388576.1 DUF308 domain-containing protein [Atopobiaceae bacterium]MCI1432075.1 DUF308 domain-containing protein [Atopobiaceae bacterium]MCI1470533.1 DUF308 domain-containing protein [Atopobiaceae bacterium]
MAAKSAGNSADELTRSRVATGVSGALLVALGIAIFTHPGETLEIVVQILGWGLAIFGAVELVLGIRASREDAPAVAGIAQRRIALGVAVLVLGIIILANPRFFVAYVFVLLGIIVLVSGVNDCVHASAARAIGAPFASRHAAMGVITLAFGVLLLVAPFSFASAATAIAGIALVFDGVTEIVAAVQMHA